MIQGWRPTSVTVQPASIAMKPIGAASDQRAEQPDARRQRPAAGSASTPAHSATSARTLPSATMTWNAKWTIGDVGPVARAGTPSSPRTSASRSWKASKRETAGDLDARSASRARSTSGQPPIVSGARRLGLEVRLHGGQLGRLRTGDGPAR